MYSPLTTSRVPDFSQKPIIRNFFTDGHGKHFVPGQHFRALLREIVVWTGSSLELVRDADSPGLPADFCVTILTGSSGVFLGTVDSEKY